MHIAHGACTQCRDLKWWKYGNKKSMGSKNTLRITLENFEIDWNGSSTYTVKIFRRKIKINIYCRWNSQISAKWCIFNNYFHYISGLCFSPVHKLFWIPNRLWTIRKFLLVVDWTVFPADPNSTHTLKWQTLPRTETDNQVTMYSQFRISRIQMGWAFWSEFLANIRFRSEKIILDIRFQRIRFIRRMM